MEKRKPVSVSSPPLAFTSLSKGIACDADVPVRN